MKVTSTIVSKRKVKGLYPFLDNFTITPTFLDIRRFDTWFEEGLSLRTSNNLFSQIIFY